MNMITIRQGLFTDLHQLNHIAAQWGEESPFTVDHTKYELYLLRALTDTLYKTGEGDVLVALDSSDTASSTTGIMPDVVGYSVSGPSQIPHSSSRVYEQRYVQVDRTAPARTRVEAVKSLALKAMQTATAKGYDYCITSSYMSNHQAFIKVYERLGWKSEGCLAWCEV